MSGETGDAPSGFTVDTLHWQIQTRFADLQRLLDERYATQTNALQSAVESQQTAMRTALAAADTAVLAALTAAEKAVEKANVAAEKRFDSVNEFRGQLADQANTFMPRAEAEVRITGLTEQGNAGVVRNSERIRQVELVIQTMPGAAEWQALQAANDMAHNNMTDRITSVERTITERITILDRSITERLATTSGHAAGSKDQVGDLRANRAGMSQMVGMAVGFAGLVVTIIVSAVVIWTALK